jgi:ATP-dependent Lon protease
MKAVADDQDLETLPLLPLKNTVLLPHTLMPVPVGRPISVAAVEAAASTEEKEIAVFAQRNSEVTSPGAEDLYGMGTKAVIKRLERHEGMLQVLLLGLERIALVRLDPPGDYLRGHIRPLPVTEERTVETEALHKEIIALAGRALTLAQPQTASEVLQAIAAIEDPLRLAYTVAAVLGMNMERGQPLLEAPAVNDALRLVHQYLSHEVQVLELRSQIASQVQSEMTKQQREHVLRQQMRAIQQELGGTPEQAETTMLREQLAKADFPEDVRKEAEREVDRLQRLPAGAPDYSVTRAYLEFILELPWNKESQDTFDLVRARQVLDEDHYDLKDAKERILEHLGVLKLNPQARAPILCFVGPPGVGKTSLGQSIARSLSRKFERLSLGGLHDEAELRGHRRTYIGAMPGRILQGIRRAGVRNPVLMLDEVDKLGRDFRGDPAAALLEILDPEQNRAFRDNYLDLPFDLSKVFFITTANTLDTIHGPLLDRMEVLRLPGYTEEEKLEIAKRYLVPRQLRQVGLAPEQCRLEQDALRKIILRYTREAGVRQLERAIGRIMRKIALHVAEGQAEPVTIRPEDLSEWLGPEIFPAGQARKNLPPGVATGLAWTETGGDVLYVEATVLPGGRGLTLTGQLGDVMQESARAAQSYVWAHADDLGIDRALFRRAGVHVHVPAGAVPKDGPSAGITMATALASVYMNYPVREDTAMTGEITLAGLVMPVGGIKEKMLAARRAGIQRVILPRENEKDLRDLPDPVQREMEFIFVDRIDEALMVAIPPLAERLQLTHL